MKIQQQLARHIREIHFGGNWTWSNLKNQLSGLTWEKAISNHESFNSIASLTCHMNYYLNAVSYAIREIPKEISHPESFMYSSVHSQKDWHSILEKTWKDAEDFAFLVDHLSDIRLWENLSEKHGTCFRNILGVIEHNHYHLGQIVIIKKLMMVDKL